MRLHKFVPDIMVKSSSTEFDPGHLASLDQFTANLREQGIYYGFSWIFTHKLRPDDRERVAHFDEIMAGGGETSRVLLFIAPDVQDLRIEMLTRLLRHQNPHTGLAYAADPALSFVEFQNEDSIFFHTFSGFNELDKFPFYKRASLKKFADWLRARYGTEEKLLAAWGPPTGKTLPLADAHTAEIDGARDRTLYYQINYR